MSNLVDVRCTHIEDELMRVRFAHSQLISDHPEQWGGTDTGPAPGEMVLMALASASAFAGYRHAARNGLDVAHISARTNMTSLQEGLPEELRDVPLPHLTYADRFWRLLEIDGKLSESERDALVEAMADNRIANTIRTGMALERRVEFHPCEAAPRRSAESGGNHRLQGRKPLPPGERRVASAADNWLVSAAALDERTCLVKAAGSMSVVGDEIASRRGATPEELLLGGLAACTTIYVARNAQFLGIDLESVSVRVKTELSGDASQPIVRAQKVTEIRGDLTDDEKSKLGLLAGHCAFGITLSQGTPIEDSVLINEVVTANRPSAGPAPLDRDAPAPNDPSYCTDGSCCVPELVRKSS